MSSEVSILQNMIKMINSIKIYIFKSCLFLQLSEMDIEYTSLLLQEWIDFPWPEFLSHSEISLSRHWQYISVTQNESQNLLAHFAYSVDLVNSICHYGEEWQLYTT